MGLTTMNPYFLSAILILHIFDFYWDLGFLWNMANQNCTQSTHFFIDFNMQFDATDFGYTSKAGPRSEAAWIAMGMPFIEDAEKEDIIEGEDGSSSTEISRLNESIKDRMLIGLKLSESDGGACPECVSLNYTILKPAERKNIHGAERTDPGEVEWHVKVAESNSWSVNTLWISYVLFTQELERTDSTLYNLRQITEAAMQNHGVRMGPENPRPPTCTWADGVVNAILAAHFLCAFYCILRSIKNKTIQGFDWRRRLLYSWIPGAPLVIEGFECYETEQELFAFFAVKAIGSLVRSLPCMWMELYFGIAGTKGFNMSLVIDIVLSIASCATTLVLYERAEVDGERSFEVELDSQYFILLCVFRVAEVTSRMLTLVCFYVAFGITNLGLLIAFDAIAIYTLIFTTYASQGYFVTSLDPEDHPDKKPSVVWTMLRALWAVPVLVFVYFDSYMGKNDENVAVHPVRYFALRIGEQALLFFFLITVPVDRFGDLDGVGPDGVHLLLVFVSTGIWVVTLPWLWRAAQKYHTVPISFYAGCLQCRAAVDSDSSDGEGDSDDDGSGRRRRRKVSARPREVEPEPDSIYKVEWEPMHPDLAKLRPFMNGEVSAEGHRASAVMREAAEVMAEADRMDAETYAMAEAMEIGNTVSLDPDRTKKILASVDLEDLGDLSDDDRGGKKGGGLFGRKKRKDKGKNNKGGGGAGGGEDAVEPLPRPDGSGGSGGPETGGNSNSNTGSGGSGSSSSRSGSGSSDDEGTREAQNSSSSSSSSSSGETSGSPGGRGGKLRRRRRNDPPHRDEDDSDAGDDADEEDAAAGETTATTGQETGDSSDAGGATAKQ
eukprot:g4139.t1